MLAAQEGKIAKVFIGYRRDDARGTAGRIYDRLADHYGERRVFRDVDAVAKGADFVETVEQAVAASDAMLVVIGPDWARITDEAGRRRLDDPSDYVRVEVERGLARTDLKVIPVLVSGASVPKAEELPLSLTPLVHRNGVEIRETRFDADVDHLIDEIGGRPRLAAWLRANRVRTALVGGGVVAAGGILVAQVVSPGLGPLGGTFNVAFAELAAAGDVEGELVAGVSAAAFDDVSGRLADFESSGAIGDLGLAGPGTVGSLAGDTPAERAESARQLAEQLDADMVLYGTLAAEGGATVFVSEMFLSDRALEDAEELAGPYRLAELSLPTTAPLTVEREVSALLRGQAATVAELVVGLRHYAVDEYSSALVHLQEAERQWQVVSGTTGTSGKEVVLHLLGNTSGQLGDLVGARSYYEQALAADPAYARSRFGLAEVRFQASLGTEGCLPAGEPDAAALETVRAEFEAVAAMAAPPLSFLPERAALEVGRVELCLALAGEARPDAAARQLEAVVAANDGSDPRLADLAAEAHQNLAVVHILGEEYQEALAAYDAAIALTFDDEERARFHSARGDVYVCYLDDPEAAEVEYRRASELADAPPERADPSQC